MVLHHELEILRRQVGRPALLPADRAFLAAAACHLPRSVRSALLVTPRTLLRWHQVLVGRKWRRDGRRPGRPRLSAEIQERVLRLGRENPRWGHRQTSGQLAKLGVQASPTSIRRLLSRARLRPAPRRSGPSWREFLHALLRLVLHRAPHPACPPGRLHQQPGRGLSDPTGAQPRPLLRRAADPLPDPRPRQQVLRPLRRGLPQRADPHPPHASRAPRAKGLASHCTSWG